ncbi:MAG: NADH-quinone oxidoreductase subunit C [Candidatus Omnitrophica bacterium]|nr:NADH-quinone oxidoreductase subunit C [Candidatus Omnitrophota bacterium]
MMLPAPDALKTAIEQALPGVTLGLEGATLIVEPKDLVRVARLLKESPAHQLEYLSNLTAIDYPPTAPAAGSAEPPQPGRIEMAYHFYSMALKHGPVAVRSKLPREDPRIASLVPLYRGAEFQEREVYDLFGVIFEGHPDLRRIFMWDGFKGYPLRKDYVVEDQNVLEGPAATAR